MSGLEVWEVFWTDIDTKYLGVPCCCRWRFSDGRGLWVIECQGLAGGHTSGVDTVFVGVVCALIVSVTTWCWS